MRFALDSSRMRAAEQAAVTSGQVTVGELMERAGHGLAGEAGRRVPEGPVVIVCGPGNNGGDGWIAARELTSRGREVDVIALRPPDVLTGEARSAALAAVDAGVRWLDGSEDPQAVALLSRAALVIDAIFGFGMHGPVRDPYAAWIDRVNASGATVVSADIPSGVDSDTGWSEGVAVKADATVTFSAMKVGLLIGDGPERSGDVAVLDLGIGRHVCGIAGAVALPGAAEVRRIIPWPTRADHKGSRGRVAVVAGSESYPGAAVLATGGALRMGAGYVHAVTPGRVGDAVLAAFPSAIVRSVPATPDGSFLRTGDVLAAIAGADAVVAGPGITRAEGVGHVVRALLAEFPGPLVLDADALNVLGADTSALRDRTAPTVITPHPGEAARLLGISLDDVLRDRPGSARALSGPFLTCVLKGSETIVAEVGHMALVRSGGPELARAGTGDVLGGMLGTLLSQGCAARDAAVAAAYLHGRAGALGAARLTVTAHIASDLLVSIPDAVRELAGG